MTHAWCHDIARDAAVRAAEDAAVADRPKLPDHRELPAAVEHLRSLCHGHFQEFEELVEIVGRINARLEQLEAMIPKSGSASSTVEQENKGVRMTKSDRQAADYRAEAIASVTERRSDQTKGDEMSQGMRTERVTLEVTGAPGWKVQVTGSDVESVRVVSDEKREVTVGDNEPWQKAILNDAVSIIVDGGDWGRGNSMDHGKLGAAVIWADKEIGRLRSRVAVMEEARKRFDTALEEARDASGINDLIVQRDEAFADRDAAMRERDAAVTESERRLRLCEAMKRDGDSARFHAACASARVAEFEAASGGNPPETPDGSTQAASGGEGEPVAWGFATPDGRLVHASVFEPERDPATIVPLYPSPPQPRGWLSEDEREAVQWAADAAYDKQHPDEDTLRSLLARSSPPEVVLPENPYHPSGLREGFDHAIRIVRNELVNAGVPVKEVP